MYSGEKTVEELKREWKKTKKEEIGVMYVNKLIAMNEYELAKKITLELKKYTKNKIDIYTTLGKIELHMGNIKEDYKILLQAKKDSMEFLLNNKEEELKEKIINGIKEG